MLHFELIDKQNAALVYMKKSKEEEEGYKHQLVRAMFQFAWQWRNPNYKMCDLVLNLLIQLSLHKVQLRMTVQLTDWPWSDKQGFNDADAEVVQRNALKAYIQSEKLAYFTWQWPVSHSKGQQVQYWSRPFIGLYRKHWLEQSTWIHSLSRAINWIYITSREDWLIKTLPLIWWEYETLLSS